MGYLDKSAITVDAILTKKGRALLANQGTGNTLGNLSTFITKFSVADDEVDYTLYDTAHPLGSNYYGSIIENMPVLEAVPDETQLMKYKILTLSDAESQLLKSGDQSTGVYLKLGVGSSGPITNVNRTIQIAAGTQDTTLKFITNGIKDTSYTVTIFDSAVATVLPSTNNPNVRSSSTSLDDTLTAFVQSLGNGEAEFKLQKKTVTVQSTTQMTVFGNDTGVTETFIVIVNPD